MSNLQPPAQTASPIDELTLDKREWRESLDYIYSEYGESGVREILRAVQDHALSSGIAINEATLNTPYINTISLHEQPLYPGDIDKEKQIENINRWNAMAMVLQAADSGSGVGGHIATYASAATMLEVGFNHFFRNKGESYGGDLVMVQPHAAPGVYARAYIEGRLNDTQLKNFRRQNQEGGGLSSYPHPRLMPDFWQVPNASMGLSTPTAIYQARFAKYLENRCLKPANGGKIWCFIGDGESDEPEVMGTINIASRENLDNLVMVVNCNLQRLDGPVRGNGKIIQELERSFRGADWNVIKVIWGSGWDVLLAQDSDGILRKRMDEAVDGDYQYFSVSEGGVQRDLWVENNPELEKLMNSLTDDEIKEIKRGGQDPKKIYAAFDKASQRNGKPSVILVKTVKGDSMGSSAQGRNTSHQKKNLSPEERLKCARDYQIPLKDDAIVRAEFYRPEKGSELDNYVQERRRELGGFLPSREVNCPSLETPPITDFDELLKGSGERETSTTTVMVRILSKLMKDKNIGRYIVPIVPDEARTFGMDGLFKVSGIYSHEGQKYTPVDADSLMPYKEAKDGQILQEGICETGAIASFLAAGTAYAIHGVPTIPFYIFYSMFGFQRVGDMIWSGGDMLCRGFLLGGTAGRTTLNGEGLQHQDGHTHILASTVPNMKTYDPAFGYEVTVLVRDGIYRMYEKQEDIFYYLTVYNENHQMPALPQCDRDAISDGIIKGGYCFKRSDKKLTKTKAKQKIHFLSSGSIMQQALSSSVYLEAQGYSVDIWSMPSFIELAREAEACDRWNRLNPAKESRIPYVEQLFSEEQGVFIAVTDYMKALPQSIARWMPDSYTVLGTDGYGISEARPDIRDYFEISDRYISQAALHALYQNKALKLGDLEKAMAELGIESNKVDPTSI